jgi:hypothetical protein
MEKPMAKNNYRMDENGKLDGSYPDPAAAPTAAPAIPVQYKPTSEVTEPDYDGLAARLHKIDELDSGIEKTIADGLAEISGTFDKIIKYYEERQKRATAFMEESNARLEESRKHLANVEAAAAEIKARYKLGYFARRAALKKVYANIGSLLHEYTLTSLDDHDKFREQVRVFSRKPKELRSYYDIACIHAGILPSTPASDLTAEQRQNLMSAVAEAYLKANATK